MGHIIFGPFGLFSKTVKKETRHLDCNIDCRFQRINVSGGCCKGDWLLTAISESKSWPPFPGTAQFLDSWTPSDGEQWLIGWFNPHFLKFDLRIKNLEMCVSRRSLGAKKIFNLHQPRGDLASCKVLFRNSAVTWRPSFVITFLYVSISISSQKIHFHTKIAYGQSK